MPTTHVTRCPYCGRWYGVDERAWPDPPPDARSDSDLPIDPGPARPARPGGDPWWRPAVTTAVCAAAAGSVVLWHADAGSILAATAISALIVLRWRQWTKSREEKR